MGGSLINFLDLTISIESGWYVFAMHRKDSYVETSIQATTVCSLTQDRHFQFVNPPFCLSPPLGWGVRGGGCHGQVNFCFDECTYLHFHTDILTIKHPVQTNGITNDIDWCLVPMTRLLLSPVTPPIPWDPSVLLGEVFFWALQNFQTIWHSTSPRWAKCSASKKIPLPLERRGVYRFHRSDCPSVYIGETGRKFCF